MRDTENNGEGYAEKTPQEVHEFARVARDSAPVTIELDEEELYALSNGETLSEVVRTHSTPFIEEDRDTWADYLELQWQTVGTMKDVDIREACPEIFEGVAEE